MIRLANPDDVAAITACATEAYEKYVQRIGTKPAPMVADFAAAVGQENVYVSVDSADEVQGFIIFYPRTDHMHLENVAVTDSNRGKGIGRKLIEFCEQQAMKAGHDSVELYTNAKMTENLTLYPRLGYTVVGRGMQDGFDRVFFRKDLGQI